VLWFWICRRIGTTGTALHAAVAGFQLQAFRLLLAAGAAADTADTKDRDGKTALFRACETGFREAAVLAVSAGGADPYGEGCTTGESAMAVLRRPGSSAELLVLAGELDSLCTGGVRALRLRTLPALRAHAHTEPIC
jgi:ankyrin repeat protein